MNLVELASKQFLRHLKPAHFLAARSKYYAAKRKLEPLILLRNGKFSTADLLQEINSRIGSDVDILMVHSSVNSLFPMYQGTAIELLNGLIEYCGSRTTLVMPAFVFQDPVRQSFASGKQEPAVFNVRRTPSQMGLITELFRRTKGAHVSRHPAYRVAALGPLAESIVRNQEQSPTGMGRGTPFDFMAIHNAHIIGIGKSFQVLTQAHHVESLLGDDFPVEKSQSAPRLITLKDGDELVEMQVGGFQTDWEFDIWKLRKIMDSGTLREWKFHGVPMFSTRAGDVTDALLAAAAKGITLYNKP
ncbi:MAG: AAC(3) family N-acetyltransferase [Pseudomonadales bacterium]|nr:AAC(3) family N-acetyltransferase [Halioglobus sp.]MCP5128680.1 AAC(3) family N-acetyltransferase [Pseudomonadales bacterium]